MGCESGWAVVVARERGERRGKGMNGNPTNTQRSCRAKENEVKRELSELSRKWGKPILYVVYTKTSLLDIKINNSDKNVILTIISTDQAR